MAPHWEPVVARVIVMKGRGVPGVVMVSEEWCGNVCLSKIILSSFQTPIHMTFCLFLNHVNFSFHSSCLSSSPSISKMATIDISPIAEWTSDNAMTMVTKEWLRYVFLYHWLLILTNCLITTRLRTTASQHQHQAANHPYHDRGMDGAGDRHRPYDEERNKKAQEMSTSMSLGP